MYLGRVVHVCAAAQLARKFAHLDDADTEGSDSAAVKLAHMLAKAPFLTEEEQACFRFLDQGFADYYGEGMASAWCSSRPRW